MKCSIARGAEIIGQWPGAEFARHPLHDPVLARAYAAPASCCATVLLRADDDFWFAPFQLRDGVATCLAQGRPMICSRGFRSAAELRMALSSISRALDALLYFPLVDLAYLQVADRDWLDPRAGAATWPRLPSPIVRGSSARAGLEERARERLGSRASRRLRRFRSAQLALSTVAGSQAISAIRQVEAASWKARLNQDMWSRGQGEVYAALLASEHALVRMASLEDVPVAYRLDYRCGSDVYVMKWSFSESVSRLSPGFYLLAVDLPQTYSGMQIDCIDLYGSPDTLKAAVCDEGWDRARVDVAFPADHAGIERLRSERRRHDECAAGAFAKGRSVRSLYE